MPEQTALHRLLLDSLEEQIVVIDSEGGIVYVNHIAYRTAMRITVSAGVASTVPDKDQAEESLVQEADKALYRAKQMGRNQVAYAQP